MQKIKKTTCTKWLTWSAALLLGGIVLTACQSESESMTSSTENNEIEIESESIPETEIDSENADKENDSEEESAISEEAISLDEGSYVVGEDFPADRYKITSSSSGNLFVENNSAGGSVSEILEDEGLNLGVPSVTVNLYDGAEVEITGFEQGIFTPVENRTVSDTLTTGAWEVGTDINEGNYEVIASGTRSGKVMIYEKDNKLPLYDELIDPDGEFGPETLTVDLKDGQILRVNVTQELTFQEK
ncbi:hypothetical protein ACM26V_18930 [Salipaludibacillus sp. HK11]|uniref:hypothetical protein n=1 Tax=Salipaludibacillus sp. HK11 TaxID=3394320 RepID=UPI0039FD8BBA